MDLKDAYEIPEKLLADLMQYLHPNRSYFSSYILTNSLALKSPVRGAETSHDVWACLADKF